MERLHFSITIDAPKEKVWDVMLGEKTYQQWTAEFGPGSHFVGDWAQGEEMQFLAPSEEGKMSGMISRVKENNPHHHLFIEHIGFIENGKKDTSSDAVKSFAGAHENYIFKELGAKTELLIEMDTNEEFKDMFQTSWPKALQKLKKIAEGQSA